MRDHGGNLDQAKARFGGEGWIDLSTGINRRTWPMPEIPVSAFTDLPTASAKAALLQAARRAWRVVPALEGVALAGAQAAIQRVPFLRPMGQARVLQPTYNEHAACLRAAGWQVQDSADLAGLEEADLAVVVNPNNPDGRCWPPETLRQLAGRVGFLVVDESFADVRPELSLLPGGAPENLLILRSFGKFYGLAGVRLGFAFGAPDLVAALSEAAGPWPVSGVALHLGTLALQDDLWAEAMRAQLACDAERADSLARRAGWTVVGGTALFRLYATPDAAEAQSRLAHQQIWSRIFPWSRHWLRLGLPGSEAEWQRLERALAA